MSVIDPRSALARWRTARRTVLGAIVLAGSIITSATVLRQMAMDDCSARAVQRSETYSGIGIGLERFNGEVIVTHVFRGHPADGKLFRGARLLSVDGESHPTLEGWVSAIRGGAPGTEVELEVEYPCGGHRTVTLTRDVIRLDY